MMIRQHGKREQLPKLLYTSQFKSTEYRPPVCITGHDWERMKYLLNKKQIEADEKSSHQNERYSLHLKSKDMTRTWRDVPGNLHLIRQEIKKEKEDNEEEEKKQLSQEMEKLSNEVKQETLAHNRLQLMCRSHKGRLLTKGILSDAAARERELQLEQKQMQREFDKMVLESYQKAVLHDQDVYRANEKNKKDAKKKANLAYYADIDKQIEFQKELKARVADENRLDSEQLKALDNAHHLENIQNIVNKKKKQKEMAAVYDEQCKQKRTIQKYEEEVNKFEDELVHQYIMNKRDIKQSHIDFLEKQKKLRQDKEDIVFNYIVQANEKKKAEDKSEEIRLKDATLIEDLAMQKEKHEKEHFKNHIKAFKDHGERQKNIWNNIKKQELTEQLEEHLRTVEDDLQDKELEKQLQNERKQFTKNIKQCQYQHILANAKQKENEKLRQRLQYQHVHAAHNQYDRDIDVLAQNLIDYAQKEGWPTDHLKHQRFTAKWCDHDHMFLRMGRSKPKVSKAIREAQYKENVKLNGNN